MTIPPASAPPLRKRYGDHVILDDVSIDVAASTVAAMSGASKSTMLRSLNMLEHPDRGSIRVTQKLLGRFGLSNKTHQYPMRCSGGRQQRMAMARALARDPAMMLFDELTS